MAEAAVGDIRLTAEYQMAWDLEMWKAQERKRFEEALAAERAAMVKDLTQRAERHDREREEAFALKKSQVERLEKRLVDSLEVLKKREEQVSSKEAELARKKASLVTDFEKKVREVEEQMRHTAEGSYYNVEMYKMKLKEVEDINKTLEQRAEKMKAEYDKLCDEFTAYRENHLAEHPDEKYQRMLHEEQERCRKLEEERDKAVEQHRKAARMASQRKLQLVKLASEYNSLLKYTHQMQVESLESERNALWRAQTLHEAAVVRDAKHRDQLRTLQLASTAEAVKPTKPSAPWAFSELVRSPPDKSGATALARELRVLLRKAKEAEEVSDDDDQLQDRGHSLPSPPSPKPEPRGATTPPKRPPPRPLPTSTSSDDDTATHPRPRYRSGLDAAALKREIENRDRLLRTGVMTEEDEYIKQLTRSIAEKKRRLGIPLDDGDDLGGTSSG